MTSAIQYQGRKARRAGSEQRRRAILEAALRIIIRDGVRSVRHRAVAKEADVPLSATTYYFKDITDLIADTFTLFAEQAMHDVIEPFRDQAFALIDGVPAQMSDEQRQSLLATLAEMTAAYVINEVHNMRDHLIAEQAFLHEALLDERLRELAAVYKQKQLDVLAGACERLGSKEPVLDAEVFFAVLYGIEQDMLAAPDKYTEADVRARVAHTLEMMARTTQAS
ncbi:TetR family transcriptional regulator [Isoalcanivorax pacificus W11-5]|uniref:TetR family transcriptional regulator n=1 Tax=Isoalcanivorax pacificus W11-5 TaxID=391936 RepID=A0A0B4XP89_9GAMM|nr:TetR family transcriptional regulator [Isoalcanivorax pacificus]AJD48916.1 TetR family transcriptional regulator [Isoalcanivorax pacificus W11-5]